MNKRHKAIGAAKKMGKKDSATHINEERKRQGYKPMSEKRSRIHEGMDKFL